MTPLPRSAGVLCHISSLPGKYGIGNLGDGARFARILAENGVRYWQILPLVQTGYGDSPYQSVSCTSGNPYFIDLDRLREMRLLTHAELRAVRARYRGERDVDYAKLYEERYATLRLAFSRFSSEDEDFRAFVERGEYEDYALFMTAKTVYGGRLCDWDRPLMRHAPEAVEALRNDYRGEYLFWQFVQYLFRMQWDELHASCRAMGLGIIGDLPLYVACDSADVWAHPELFKLDKDLKLTKVAGVPPDYFSATGQLWGNPIYDWAAHKRENFAWWHARIRAALETYDLVRIDHFRGLDRYYEIDADAENAVRGEWKKAPGNALFAEVEKGRIIAEDLGILDDGVRRLLKKTGLPGMKVLLFAFDGNRENDHLPANLREHTVYYTGTHDNDTVMGYVQGLSAGDRARLIGRVKAALREAKIPPHIGNAGEGMATALIRLALSSRAYLAVIPIQDILGLGNEARMNEPGTSGKNWRFRLTRQPSAQAMGRLNKMIKQYGR